MMIGPAPMIRIEEMSVRLAIGRLLAGTRTRPRAAPQGAGRHRGERVRRGMSLRPAFTRSRSRLKERERCGLWDRAVRIVQPAGVAVGPTRVAGARLGVHSSR